MQTRKMTPAVIIKYLKYLEQEERSRATIEKYQRDLQKFYDFLPAGKRINKERTLQYKAHLAETYKPASTNSMLAALNGYLTYCGMESCRVRQLKVQRQMFTSAARELTREDYKRLLKTAKQTDERLYQILQTICGTGIRISELPAFTIEGIREGKLQIHCKNKIRVVWIPRKLSQQLLAYAARNGIKTGPVFVTGGNKPVDRSNVWARMKTLSSLAGVDPQKVFPHNLRHLFARVYYQREKDIVKLADILGHTSVETTRIYTATTGQVHAQQLERLGLLL